LAGCTTTSDTTTSTNAAAIDPAYLGIYSALPEERFPVPAVDLGEIDPAFLRRVVDDPTGA
jgi:hypothetical protein